MRKLIPVAAVLAAVLVAAPVAVAAASPTVTASAVTRIGDTAATLHGAVRANGLPTTYHFEYGPTTALGTAVPATPGSAGSGTTAVARSARVTGLSPDTTYYYELVATNSAGTSSTPVESFKTTGNPAPTSTTDPAAGVARYVATLVGTIAPNNQQTSYYFEYGPTSSYGFQTALASIPAGTAPATVTTVLPGLEPGAVFHYRLVSSHGPTSTTYGADMTFATLPWPRRRTGMSIALTPRSARGTSARFTVHGSIRPSTSTSAGLGCHGIVTLRYYAGGRRLATRRAFVGSNCRFSAGARIRYSARVTSLVKRTTTRRSRARAAMRITVRARFGGNSYQAPVRRAGLATLR